MLQNDMALKRTLPLGGARSVLAFYNFLKSAAGGVYGASITLPFQHISFYRKTVERLVAAEALPFGAKEQFEEAFSSGFAKAFVS
jgi:hypothetical protein